MNNLFPPELRTAAVVKRWSIVRTFNSDSVAEHSFFVSFYALQIARLVHWEGPLADLSFYALMHDIEETITGDIVSPVKHAIIDEGASDNFISEQMKARLPLVEAQLSIIMESKWGSNIERIVRVADKVDAVLFLTTEQRMGNVVLAPLHHDAMENLIMAWHDLGVELYVGTGEKSFDVKIEAHRQFWNDEIYPALQAQWKHGGVGVQ